MHIMHSNAYQFKFETFSCNLHMNLASIWATIQIWKSCHMKPSHRIETYSLHLTRSFYTSQSPSYCCSPPASLSLRDNVPHYAKWNIFANCNIAIMVSDNDNANWISLWCPFIFLHIAFTAARHDTIVDCGFNHNMRGEREKMSRHIIIIIKHRFFIKFLPMACLPTNIRFHLHSQRGNKYEFTHKHAWIMYHFMQNQICWWFSIWMRFVNSIEHMKSRNQFY